ncbi:MAG: hypothetical protein ACI91J_001212, partial [Yoonia sp.]
EDPETADIIAAGIAFHLTKSDFADSRLRQFTQREVEAIAAFLDWCAREYGEDGICDKRFRKAESAVRNRIREM